MGLREGSYARANGFEATEDELEVLVHAICSSQCSPRHESVVSCTCPLSACPFERHTNPNFVHTCARELEHVGRRRLTDQEWVAHAAKCHKATVDAALLLSRSLGAACSAVPAQSMAVSSQAADTRGALAAWSHHAYKCPMGCKHMLESDDVNLLRMGLHAPMQRHLLRSHLDELQFISLLATYLSRSARRSATCPLPGCTATHHPLHKHTNLTAAVSNEVWDPVTFRPVIIRLGQDALPPKIPYDYPPLPYITRSAEREATAAALPPYCTSLSSSRSCTSSSSSGSSSDSSSSSGSSTEKERACSSAPLYRFSVHTPTIKHPASATPKQPTSTPGSHQPGTTGLAKPSSNTAADRSCDSAAASGSALPYIMFSREEEEACEQAWHAHLLEAGSMHFAGHQAPAAHPHSVDAACMGQGTVGGRASGLPGAAGAGSGCDAGGSSSGGVDAHVRTLVLCAKHCARRARNAFEGNRAQIACCWTPGCGVRGTSVGHMLAHLAHMHHEELARMAWEEQEEDKGDESLAFLECPAPGCPYACKRAPRLASHFAAHHRDWAALVMSCVAPQVDVPPPAAGSTGSTGSGTNGSTGAAGPGSTGVVHGGGAAGDMGGGAGQPSTRTVVMKTCWPPSYKPLNDVKEISVTVPVTAGDVSTIATGNLADRAGSGTHSAGGASGVSQAKPPCAYRCPVVLRLEQDSSTTAPTSQQYTGSTMAVPPPWQYSSTHTRQYGSTTQQHQAVHLGEEATLSHLVTEHVELVAGLLAYAASEALGGAVEDSSGLSSQHDAWASASMHAPSSPCGSSREAGGGSSRTGQKVGEKFEDGAAGEEEGAGTFRAGVRRVLYARSDSMVGLYHAAVLLANAAVAGAKEQAARRAVAAWEAAGTTGFEPGLGPDAHAVDRAVLQCPLGCSCSCAGSRTAHGSHHAYERGDGTASTRQPSWQQQPQQQEDSARNRAGQAAGVVVGYADAAGLVVHLLQEHGRQLHAMAAQVGLACTPPAQVTGSSPARRMSAGAMAGVPVGLQAAEPRVLPSAQDKPSLAEGLARAAQTTAKAASETTGSGDFTFAAVAKGACETSTAKAAGASEPVRVAATAASTSAPAGAAGAAASPSPDTTAACVGAASAASLGAGASSAVSGGYSDKGGGTPPADVVTAAAAAAPAPSSSAASSAAAAVAAAVAALKAQQGATAPAAAASGAAKSAAGAAVAAGTEAGATRGPNTSTNTTTPAAGTTTAAPTTARTTVTAEAATPRSPAPAASASLSLAAPPPPATATAPPPPGLAVVSALGSAPSPSSTSSAAVVVVPTTSTTAPTPSGTTAHSTTAANTTSAGMTNSTAPTNKTTSAAGATASPPTITINGVPLATTPPVPSLSSAPLPSNAPAAATAPGISTTTAPSPTTSTSTTGGGSMLGLSASGAGVSGPVGAAKFAPATAAGAARPAAPPAQKQKDDDDEWAPVSF